jgi:hypothetical protein
MHARVVSREADEGGVVTLEIGGVHIAAMDNLSYGKSEQAYPNIGDEFVVEFSCMFSDDVTWMDVFSGNAEGRSELVPTGTWSYSAFGSLVSVDGENGDAIARCGACDLPLPIQISDRALIGSFVSFDVQRLDAWRA